MPVSEPTPGHIIIGPLSNSVNLPGNINTNLPGVVGYANLCYLITGNTAMWTNFYLTIITNNVSTNIYFIGGNSGVLVVNLQQY
jgi:hypothetical protein